MNHYHLNINNLEFGGLSVFESSWHKKPSLETPETSFLNLN